MTNPPHNLSRQDAALLLGVAVSADLNEVKRRYRLLARSTHPDAGGDPDEFAQIRQAYERLIIDDAPAAPTQVRRPSRAPAPTDNIATYLDVDTIPWATAINADDVSCAEQLAAYLAPPQHSMFQPYVAYSRAPGARTNRYAANLSTELVSILQVHVATHGQHATQVTITLDAKSRKSRRAIRQLDTDPRWIKQRRSSGIRLRCAFTTDRDRTTAATSAAARTQEILTHLSWPLTQWQTHHPTNGATS